MGLTPDEPLGAHLDSLQTLTYGRDPPGPVVNGVLRTHDGVVNLWPNAMLRLRKAATLPKSPVHSPASRSLEGQAVAQKVEFSRRPNLARRTAPSRTEFKTVPEIALGHARLARRADLAVCPLDFECWTGVLNFQISGARFQDPTVRRTDCA